MCTYLASFVRYWKHIRHVYSSLSFQERRESAMYDSLFGFGKGGEAETIPHVEPLFSSHFSAMCEEKRRGPLIVACWVWFRPGEHIDLAMCFFENSRKGWRTPYIVPTSFSF